MILNDRIYSLHDLYETVQEHRAVYSKKQGMLRKPRPAAFVMNMSGTIIWNLIQSGLFVYKKGEEDGK